MRPCMVSGAMVGRTVSSVAHALLPGVTASPGAYALVGMGTAFAGIVRVPLASVIMIFEVTRDYSIIVPLMISNLISYFVSSQLQKEAIYEALQHQDGVYLPAGASAREALLHVGEGVRPPGAVVDGNLTVTNAAAALAGAEEALPVLNGNIFL